MSSDLAPQPLSQAWHKGIVASVEFWSTPRPNSIKPISFQKLLLTAAVSLGLSLCIGQGEKAL